MNTKSKRPSPQALTGLALFRGADLEAIAGVLEDCPIRALQSGETLIAAGKPTEYLYLILEGRLQVELMGDAAGPVAVLEAGESVAEIGVIDRQPSSANVVATQPTRVISLDEDHLLKLVKLSHEVAFNLLVILAERLRYGSSVIHRIHALLREYEHDATIDPLTGVFNRRWLDNMIRRQVHRATAGKQALSVAMIDIDHFKEYNDANGHLAGDRALRLVAVTLVAKLRPEDTITRYGGEELLALLPGSDLEEARMIAERLREAIAALPLPPAGSEGFPALTVSIGIAELARGQSAERLIEAADSALYRAKRDGRNCVRS
jgi:diguanylate cyclase (GGDEF)-like protein